MKNTFFSKSVIFFFLLIAIVRLNAQLTIDIGTNKTVCIGAFGIQDTYRLGGTPTIRGGTPPYKIEWSTTYNYTSRNFIYASGFLVDTSVANPIFRFGFATLGSANTAKFYLKVTDAAQRIGFDSVMVSFSKFMVLGIGTNRILPLGDSLQIYAATGGGFGPLKYRWTPNYNISDTTSGAPFVWPRRSTTYSCRVMDSAGCVSGFILDWVIGVISDTKEINNLLKVSIYPNPLVTASQLSIDSEDNADKTLAIYNSAGQMIYGQKIMASKIPIGQFIKDNGTYFYQISSNNQLLAVGKFVKN